MRNTPDDPVWLPLGRAAHLLGVHPTTLRRWSENGDISVMLTPGGHRRYAVADLDHFASRRLQGHSPNVPNEGVFSDRPVRPASDDPHHPRAIERHLVRLASSIFKRSTDEPELLEEARAIGREQVVRTLPQQLSLTEINKTSLFFRHREVDVVLTPRPDGNGDPPTLAQMRRLSTLLDAVQVSISGTVQESLDL